MARERKARKTYKARDTEEGRAAHAAEEAERRKRLREKRLQEKQGKGLAEGPGAGEEPAATASREAPMVPCVTAAKATPAAGAAADEPREAAAGSGAMVRAPGAPEPGALPMAGPADATERPSSVCVGDRRCVGQKGDQQRSSVTAPNAVVEDSDATSNKQTDFAPLPPVFLSPAREEPEPIEWILVVPPDLLGAAQQRAGTDATCPFCGRRGRIRRVVSSEQWRRWIRYGLDPPP